ncbi:MAG: type II secretion system protein [Clostridium sp.]|mgnify:CR=1 FL=1|nr:type II secretion system protein [Clostridium sp.]
MLKNKKGITLIALVVTIVVLLILAGVTISLLLDENGIIAKSKDARTETRVSQIEDEVGMWKQHNFINKESNQAQENADTMLANLISRKLLTEEEIDRDQELITIKKKDGTIIKEISYSNVTINISKTPATEKSGAVVLKVDSVEGITMPNIDMSNGDEELNNFINSLSEEEKKEIIKYAYIKLVNKADPSANCTTFQDVLDWLKNKNNIEEATETAFWNSVESTGGIDKAMGMMEVLVNEDTNMIEGYTVTNPDNETSNTYIATENGTYTFKIQDVLTGKTYTKNIRVNNIDESLKDKYEVTNSPSEYVITLLNKQTNELVEFSKAYIITNEKAIDISMRIQTDTEENISYIRGKHMQDLIDGGIGEYNFILINDEGAWQGKAKVKWEVY